MELILRPKVTRQMLEVAATQVLAVKYRSKVSTVAPVGDCSLDVSIDPMVLAKAMESITKADIVSHLSYLLLHHGLMYFSADPECRPPMSFLEFSLGSNVDVLLDRFSWE